MISIPEAGFNHSVNRHNVKLDVFCDWIEGNLLFSYGELSHSDIIDVLCENNIYREQDFAAQLVSNGWTELRHRTKSMGVSSPYEFNPSNISCKKNWQDIPAHSFCVLLALSKWYGTWARKFGSDYTKQGEIFEELAKESLEKQFTDWEIVSTGWSKAGTESFSDKVHKIANLLGESVGDISKWTNQQAKDLGLDLLCYRKFPDNRVGIPLYLMQCASGGNWESKLDTPSLRVWENIVQFAAPPAKAFATPFSLLNDDFIRCCCRAGGMLLDRYRLLAAGLNNPNWLSQQLKQRIITWAQDRVKLLPLIESY